MNTQGLQRLVSQSMSAAQALKQTIAEENSRYINHPRAPHKFPAVLSGASLNPDYKLVSDWPIFSFRPFSITPTFWLEHKSGLSMRVAVGIFGYRETFEVIDRNYSSRPVDYSGESEDVSTFSTF